VNVAGWNTVAIHFYAKHGAEPMKPGWMLWTDFPKVEKSAGSSARQPRLF
jgi:hypothetical protein